MLDGEGANAAMLDAAVLAGFLLEHEDDVETALARYEADMFPRAAEAARQSAFGLDLIFNADAPRDLVDFFTSMPEPVEAGADR